MRTVSLELAATSDRLAMVGDPLNETGDRHLLLWLVLKMADILEWADFEWEGNPALRPISPIAARGRLHPWATWSDDAEAWQEINPGIEPVMQAAIAGVKTAADLVLAGGVEWHRQMMQLHDDLQDLWGRRTRQPFTVGLTLAERVVAHFSANPDWASQYTIFEQHIRPQDTTEEGSWWRDVEQRERWLATVLEGAQRPRDGGRL